MLAFIEILFLGMLDVVIGLVAIFDFSETGGEGGVGASERPDEDAVFVGGVSSPTVTNRQQLRRHIWT